MTVRARVDRLLNRPHYIYRPKQLLARFAKPDKLYAQKVSLPWGLEIAVDPEEALGARLVRNGVYEIAVTEMLWRLCDPGDVAVDVGANIGYMTSVFARRAAAGGVVYSVEPHPGLFAALTHNVERWRTHLDAAEVRLMQVAAGKEEGSGLLRVPWEFGKNRGVAHMAGREPASQDSDVRVRVLPLDRLLARESRVGVMKLDVEGYEALVLEGAEGLLSERKVRDVVFECDSGYPSDPASILERHGYVVMESSRVLSGRELATRRLRQRVPTVAR